jgi:hypothetical protein
MHSLISERSVLVLEAICLAQTNRIRADLVFGTASCLGQNLIDELELVSKFGLFIKQKIRDHM